MGCNFDNDVEFLFTRPASFADLLQRRGTDARGNTVWQTTALVDAALSGGACSAAR